jgi:His/Glu/Gln/Arg/opine family amino acid ABC transporter permease subunit
LEVFRLAAFWSQTGAFFQNTWTALAQQIERNFIAADRWKMMLGGLEVTLYVSLLAVFLGIALGVFLALMRLSRYKLMSFLAGGYIDIIRGTPVVVQLMIFYFVLLGPHTQLDRTIIAAIAFGCNSAAYVAEIVRGGILSIDHGQTEAGRSLGLTETMTMRYIVLPQAFKNILPSLGNELIMLIKETSILGYIGVVDLARAGEQIRARTFEPFTPLLAVAMVYYALVKLLSFLLKRLERRLRESDQR